MWTLHNNLCLYNSSGMASTSSLEWEPRPASLASPPWFSITSNELHFGTFIHINVDLVCSLPTSNGFTHPPPHRGRPLYQGKVPKDFMAGTAVNLTSISSFINCLTSGYIGPYPCFFTQSVQCHIQMANLISSFVAVIVHPCSAVQCSAVQCACEGGRPLSGSLRVA